MDDTKKLILAAVIVVVLIGGLLFTSKSGKIPLPNNIKVASPTPSEEKSGTVIAIENYSYSPANLVVKAGETVTWTNNDSVGHSSTSDDSAFDTGLIGQGNKASVTFDKPGTYSYHCTPHPQMQGTIIVE